MSLGKLFARGRPHLLAVSADDGRVSITFKVAGRTFTLPKAYVETYLDDLLADMPPWCEAGWLEREYRQHGNLTGIGKAQGFSDAETRAMNHYAAKELDWRIQEGYDIKRWELYTRFFDTPDTKARGSASALGRALDLFQANVSLWLREARQGKFFSKAMTLERLAPIQSELFDPVYFPGEEEGRDYALFKAEGWPQLPRGLLSDLLPLLDNLELISSTVKDNLLTLRLEHFGQPLVFDLEVESAPAELSRLQNVRAEPGGKLALTFAESVVSGPVVRVLCASAGNFYLLR